MKIKTLKIILFLLITTIILAISIPVKAATSYGVELISNVATVNPGQEIEITIKVKDIVDISGGIAGLSAKLEYDTTKLEKTGNGQSLNNFMIAEGNTIELAKYPGVTSDTEIAKFTFKVKNNATGDAQIKLSNVEVVNGTDTFKLNKEVTKTISITSSNTPSDQPSNNTNLSNISIDGTQLSNFNKDTLTYTLQAVENTKTTINISATAEDTKAKISGTGTKNLNVGKNSFEIVVTAEDGSQKTYTIDVERKSTNINSNNTDNNNSKDNTQSSTILPQTGETTLIFIILGIIIVVLIVSYLKIKKFSGIK